MSRTVLFLKLLEERDKDERTETFTVVLKSVSCRPLFTVVQTPYLKWKYEDVCQI